MNYAKPNIMVKDTINSLMCERIAFMKNRQPAKNISGSGPQYRGATYGDALRVYTATKVSRELSKAVMRIDNAIQKQSTRIVNHE